MTVDIVNQTKEGYNTIFTFNVDGVLSNTFLSVHMPSLRSASISTYGKEPDMCKYIENQYKIHIRNGYIINGKTVY